MKNNIIKGPGGEMLIGGWVAPPQSDKPEEDFITDEAFAEVRESGLNVVYTSHWDLSDLARLKKAADIAGRNGVKLNVNSDFLARTHAYTEKQIEDIIAFCRENENIIGVCFDEPRATDFAALKESKEKYGFDESQDDLLFYVNMVPTYADATLFFGESASKPTIKERYAGFIEEYVRTVRPAFLSFDFYPFRFEKGVCDPEYFLQLSVCKKIADRYGIPLWNFIQVTSWSKEYVRNMTYVEILWQVSTALAYGVTGIQYFCYWTPADGGGEMFRSAMIARDGTRMPWWYYVREVNRHLKAVQKYFLAAEHKGIITVLYGDTLAPVPEEDRLFSYGNLEEKIETDGVVIGCFKHKGKNMYYIVNTSLFEERVVKLKFSHMLKLRQIRGAVQTEFACDKWDEVLHPGEGALLLEI